MELGSWYKLRQYLLRNEADAIGQVSSLIAQGSARFLEDLGLEAREENSQMHALSKRAAHDAAAVKVLSIMAMLYLPSTFVSVRCRGLMEIFFG